MDAFAIRLLCIADTILLPMLSQISRSAHLN